MLEFLAQPHDKLAPGPCGVLDLMRQLVANDARLASFRRSRLSSMLSATGAVFRAVLHDGDSNSGHVHQGRRGQLHAGEWSLQ